MIHHVSVGTNDLKKARAFYDPVLQHLGLHILFEGDKSAGYGVSDFLFSIETPVNGKPATAGNGVHIAFQAKDKNTVREFHRIALANGGTNDGNPSLRPEYDANYFGAFVYDPDGNKIEAVTYSAK